MKKVVTILIVMMLLGTLVFAEANNQAIKRVQWSREMLKLSQTEQPQLQTQAQNRVQIASDREVAMRNRIGRIQGNKTTHRVQSKLQMLQGVGGFQPVQSSRQKFAPHSVNVAAMPDSLTLMPGQPDTAAYIAGCDLFLFVYSDDTVAVKFFVDDGDSVLTESDFLIDFDMDGAETKVWDGIEFDETPPGDGIFQVTINTGNIGSDGPEAFFGIQNEIVFIEGVEINDGGEFLGMAMIGAPDEGISVSGSVMLNDTTGPASDMIVFAVQMPEFGAGEDWIPEIGFLAMTDSDGYYRIGIPREYPGFYMIGVGDIWGLYPGYFPDPPQYEMPVNGDIRHIDFVMNSGNESISGVVEDESATGVGNVRVRAWGPYGETEATTDEFGSYTIPAMPGWWEVGIVENDIYGQYMIPYTQSLEVFEGGGDHPANFTLYSLNSEFTGNVVTSTAEPLMGVEIFTTIDLGQQGGYYNWTETDASGNYELLVSPALQGQPIVWEGGGSGTSSYWIGAWMEDALFTPDSYFDQYAPAGGLDFTAIVADASLSGTVYDADSNDRLWDAEIHAYLPDSSGMGLDFWTNTDESGYYELPLIGGAYPGLTWLIEVYYPYVWMAPALFDSLTVISGNHYTRDYYISPPATEGRIDGYVYDGDGNGIPNARVEFYGPDYYEVYTDGSGYFSVERVPFGWYTATAYAEGYDPYDIYDIYVGPEPTYLEFWMGSIVGNIMVNGQVVDESNAPINGALLMLYNWEYNEPLTLFTGDSGYFDIKVKPGWYDFQVGANGYGAIGQGLDIYNDTTLTYQLTSMTIPDTLEGNVVDDSGNPLRKVFVYMEKYNDNDEIVEYMGYCYTDLIGHYKLALPAGEIDAMYAKEGFNTEWRWFDFPNNLPEDPITLYSNVHVFGPELRNVADVPEDHGKQVRLTWKRAEGLQGSVKEYQIWRAVERFNGPEPNGEVTYSWDFVTTVPVRPEMEIYNVVVPTLYDKVGNDIYWTGFVITATGYDNWSHWDSNILAGWSEDNLPPSVPTTLTASNTGSTIELSWDAVTSERIKYYTVYRKTASNDYAVLGYATAAEYVDNEIEQSQVYTYTVSATDFGLNESNVSESCTVSLLAIDAEEALPKEFALNPNYPNPFNPETTIEFALPEDSKVTLTIYNLRGQMVRQLVSDSYKAGYQRVIWNGRDYAGNAVGSGVYIYTLRAGDFSKTRKMILMR